MSLWQRIWGWVSGRSIENPAIPMSQAVDELLDAFGAGTDPSGQHVNARTAQRFSPVYACVRIIAETAGSLPIAVFRETSLGQFDPDPRHPLATLLQQPNPWQTGQVFREQLFKSMMLWGNAYAEIVRSAGGVIEALIPLDPSRTRPYVEGRRLFYDTLDDLGSRRSFFPDEILHIPLLPNAGSQTGEPPPAIARTAIGLGLAAETHSARFFAQGALGPMAVEIPNRWDDESFNRFRKQIEEARRGGRGVIIFEAGMKPHDIKQDLPAYLEIRRFQVLEVSRIYGVPPHMIGESEKGAPKSSVEEQEREFAKHTLRPLLKRFEAEYDRKLFLADRGGRHVVRHDLSELLTADTRTTWQTFSVGRQMGIYNVNEIRQRIGMPGIGPAGDQYLSPVNLDRIPRGLAGLDGTRLAALGLAADDVMAAIAGGNGHGDYVEP